MSNGDGAAEIQNAFDVERADLRTDSEFSYLFAACERLTQFILNQFPRQGIATEAHDSRFLTWTIVMRGIKTFDALLVLADRGYGVQATMLSRTLFEDTVSAWWCSSRPTEELLELMLSHDKSVSLALHRERPGREYFEALAKRQPLEDEHLQRFIDEHGIDARRARALWTGKTIASMVNEIEPHLDEQDVPIMRLLFDVAYLLSNLMVHNSPVSMGTAMRSTSVRSDGVPETTLSRRPSRLFVHDALTIGYLSLSILGRLVTQPTATSELNRILSDSRPLFIVVDGDTVQRTGRNDPCPCGSGRKNKHCHGRHL
ncbi:MAG: DUF5677 domain-containing protein [Ilumatobacteraceae bacterium]